MLCNADLLRGACGVAHLFNFEGEWADYDLSEVDEVLGGAGYATAGFIDTPLCKRFYEEVQKFYDIVFQTPVALNENSGNQFFFIVFKGKEKV